VSTVKAFRGANGWYTGTEDEYGTHRGWEGYYSTRELALLAAALDDNRYAIEYGDSHRRLFAAALDAAALDPHRYEVDADDVYDQDGRQLSTREIRELCRQYGIKGGDL
jgi:hypothetical protein